MTDLPGEPLTGQQLSQSIGHRLAQSPLEYVVMPRDWMEAAAALLASSPAPAAPKLEWKGVYPPRCGCDCHRALNPGWHCDHCCFPAAPAAPLASLERLRELAIYCFNKHGNDAYLYNSIAKLAGMNEALDPPGRPAHERTAPKEHDLTRVDGAK